MKAVRLRAHAKVNLTLEVVGRRPDGYHEVRSVFARISLADTVRVARAPRWRVVVRPPLGEPGPDLAERAARGLAERLGRADAAAITITKRVPSRAGLGGGSSDAAATLRALRALWAVGDDEILREAALATGSDVPFFLDGALAEVRGRGEAVRPLQGGPWHGLLVRVAGAIATSEAYARLARSAWSDGARTAALVEALATEANASTLRAHCANAFDAVARELCPPIEAARAAAAPDPLFLTGTGPTLFALADHRGHALALARRVRRAGFRAVPVLLAVDPT